MRVYITTEPVGQCFGTIGVVKLHYPGCADHGKRLATTDVRPHGFTTAAANAAFNLAEARGWTVVDEEYQP